MAKQILNIGSSANDGSGTTLRAGGDIINDNFNEIYTAFGDGSTLSSQTIPSKVEGTNFTGSLLVGHSTTGTLASATGDTGVGIGALDALTSGDHNTALGQAAGSSVTSGSHNTFLGRAAGFLVTGSDNTLVGRNAGVSIVAGSNNITLGKDSGQNITSGSGNVIIGEIDADSGTGNRQLKIAGYDGSDTTRWISGDSSGNLTTVGDVTLANDKKVIFGDAGENIAGDGTDLTISSSGKTIVDSTGDVELDAASGIIDFITNGTVFGNVAASSNNFTINARQADKDLLFKGVDGSSEITALTLDMSDAGSASFNNDAYFGDNGKIKLGASSDLQIYHDGSNSYVTDQGAGDLIIGGSSTIHVSNAAFSEDMAVFNNNGSVDLYHNNSKKFETTAAGATVTGALTISGDLTVNGTTTTVNSTNTTLDDNLLELNSGATSNANDSGILIERGSTGDNAIIMWDESADKFVLGTTTATADSTGNISVTTGTLVANLEGNITGNISTATALATGRTIGMTGDVVWTSGSFDGSGNVTGTSALQANTVSSTELVSATTLLILDSSGSTLKTIIGAGS